MRPVSIVLAVIAIPSMVAAEPVGELTGGLAIPTSNSDWTNVADASPKLRVAGGAVSATGLGGLLTFDWTPVSLDNSGGSFGGLGGADISAHRFRVLANATFDRAITPKVVLAGRIGGGIDIARASARVTVLGATTTSSDSDLGFAFEFAAGLWVAVGSVEVGGELALPIGHHDKRGNGSDGNYTFDYTSLDVDLMIGVRLMSR